MRTCVIKVWAYNLFWNNKKDKIFPAVLHKSYWFVSNFSESQLFVLINHVAEVLSFVQKN